MGAPEADETSGRNLDVVGGIWAASGKHPGSIWEASGRHPSQIRGELGLQEAMGLQDAVGSNIDIPLS